MHTLGVEVAFWLGASFILAGSRSSGQSEGGGSAWRRAISTPVIAILASLLLNFVHLGSSIPAWLLGGARMLGASAIPMALLLTGATLSDFLSEVRPSRSGAVTVSGACLLRLGLLPFAFLALARWAPCSLELKQVLIVQAAMPCAMLPIVLTKHYGGDTGMAVQIVTATTALAIFTIPYWMRFGMQFASL